MRMCTVRNCTVKHYGLGFCERHYIQLKKHGHITSTLPSFYEKRPAIVKGDTARIPIGVAAKDGYILVDKEFAYLDNHKWYLCSTGYAKTFIDNKKPKIHQLILNIPKGLVGEHKNGDKLDNRRSNLRIATQRQNAANTRVRSNNTSGFKGVSWDKEKTKWVAQLHSQGVNYFLGYHSTPEEAHKAYAIKASEVFGEFARVS